MTSLIGFIIANVGEPELEPIGEDKSFDLGYGTLPTLRDAMAEGGLELDINGAIAGVCAWIAHYMAQTTDPQQSADNFIEGFATFYADAMNALESEADEEESLDG